MVGVLKGCEIWFLTRYERYLSAGLYIWFCYGLSSVVLLFVIKSKEEVIDHASIQSNTTPDPGHHMGKCQNTRKHIIQERQEVSPFPAGDYKEHIICLFDLILYVPVNNLSVMSGRVILG